MRNVHEVAAPQLKLSIVLPTFNELDRLPDTLREVTEYLTGRYRDFEIIVVDDDSPDGTAQYVRDLNDPRFKILVQAGRIGKGAAVRRGCLAATGDLILYMDADHATHISEIEKFLEYVDLSRSMAVVGVRTYQEDESRGRRILGLFGQILAHLIVFKKAVVDSQCGFKLFTPQAIKTVFPLSRTNGGMIDVELFLLMHKYEVPAYFVPVHWQNKPNSKINLLMCMVRDPIELVRIRSREIFGIYDKKFAPTTIAAPVDVANIDSAEEHLRKKASGL